jgi:hypothetical protein
VLDLLTSALVRLAAHVNAVQLLKTSVEVRGGGRAQQARGQLKDTKATAWCSVGDELASISGVRRVQEGVLGFQIVACNCTEYPTSFCKHNPIVGKKKVQEPGQEGARSDHCPSEVHTTLKSGAAAGSEACGWPRGTVLALEPPWPSDFNTRFGGPRWGLGGPAAGLKNLRTRRGSNPHSGAPGADSRRPLEGVASP